MVVAHRPAWHRAHVEGSAADRLPESNECVPHRILSFAEPNTIPRHAIMYTADLSGHARAGSPLTLSSFILVESLVPEPPRSPVRHSSPARTIDTPSAAAAREAEGAPLSVTN